MELYSPRDTQIEVLLLHDEGGEDANQSASRREHDDDPKVELLVGPVIGLAHDHARARHGARHAAPAAA